MDINSYVPEYEYSRAAENFAARYIESDLEAVASFNRWLEEVDDPPTSVTTVKKRHIQRWLTWILRDCASATAKIRFRGLKNFFNWLLEEEEIGAHPFAGLKAPKVESKEYEILDEEDLKALVDTCQRNTLWGCRDAAIIRVLIDTGMRRAEVTNLQVSDIDFDDGTVHISWTYAKGRKERTCTLHPPTIKALRRYLRYRGEHPGQADAGHLWVGQKGPLKVRGVGDMIDRRARQAGVRKISPHVFRHTFAHRYLAAGGQETNLMRHMGWTSRDMVARYAASLGVQRAHEEYHRLNLAIA